MRSTPLAFATLYDTKGYHESQAKDRLAKLARIVFCQSWSSSSSRRRRLMASLMVKEMAANPTAKPMRKNTTPMARSPNHATFSMPTIWISAQDTHAARQNPKDRPAEQREAGDVVPGDAIHLGIALVARKRPAANLHAH